MLKDRVLCFACKDVITPRYKINPHQITWHGGEPNIWGTRNVAKYKQILIDGPVFSSGVEHVERQVKCK